jgi:hypothetical protein
MDLLQQIIGCSWCVSAPGDHVFDVLTAHFAEEAMADFFTAHEPLDDEAIGTLR